jgi:hypothetical protein
VLERGADFAVDDVFNSAFHIPLSAFENGGSTMNKRLALITVLLFGLGVVLASCAQMKSTAKPTAETFKAPTITLAEFAVPSYNGYWFYGAKITPTKGKAGNHGAFLPMTFLFNIENPNPYPIMLEGFQFTVGFDYEFDLVTVHNQDSYWIPAGKTDQIRANTVIDVYQALLSLLVTGGFKLKEKGWGAYEALEKWWTGVPVYAVPVHLHEGAFNFSADGVTKVVSYKVLIPAD